MPHEYQRFPYVAPPGLTEAEPRHPVVIVGAGPVGLAAALDLAGQGIACLVVDDNDVVSVGSRAICWSKRSLEILDRLGLGEACLARGVTWKVGRTFHRTAEVFSVDLQPEAGHKMPAFVNLQQYHVEAHLIRAALASPLVELRFLNRVTGLRQEAEGVTLRVETPDGSYDLPAAWVLACDGASSPIRRMMGLDFTGDLFEDRFLIADIEMRADTPPERWFWFEPDFHPGQSALLHKQPDNIYRIDLQLGWDADVEAERQPDRIRPRIEKVVGHGDFRLDWSSVYTFQCRRLDRFVHERVIFAGDSAHVVSPFGARGGNGGLQDVDALGWRLAAVVNGADPEILTDYERERRHAADENIRNSSRATRFMSPAPGAERWFRDATLALAAHAEFARPMVNSGRLSVPCRYPLAGAPDDATLPDLSAPGCVAPDAPLGDGWLLNRLGGQVSLLVLNRPPPQGTGLPCLAPPPDDLLRARYLGEAEGAIYLIRPDQVIAARWITADPPAIAACAARLTRPA
ncbi:FAD-dependent monooxygenase [Pseudooceanicola aestuarii]|uniref:FAD-dependent monooxygenase n=1 Tax=Pseudooceanicola aestuarii TaxID=2697319 RepID=UPI0013D4A702|nr:FAD-dependent monooxygenase [Pseudooceanicola aestuarii]